MLTVLQYTGQKVQINNSRDNMLAVLQYTGQYVHKLLTIQETTC